MLHKRMSLYFSKTEISNILECRYGEPFKGSLIAGEIPV